MNFAKQRDSNGRSDGMGSILPQISQHNRRAVNHVKRYCSSLRDAWNVFLPIGKDESVLPLHGQELFFLNANIPSVCRLLLLLTQNNCDIAIIPTTGLCLRHVNFIDANHFPCLLVSELSLPHDDKYCEALLTFTDKCKCFLITTQQSVDECQVHSAEFLALQWEWVKWLP